MARYRIREWDERYEVDARGGVWSPGRPRRSGPLKYIRYRSHGKSLGLGWRKLIQVAGRKSAPGIFGIFVKLLEVSGDAEWEDRGFFEDTPELPISFVLDLDPEEVKSAISVLVAIGWIAEIEAVPGTPRNSPELPGIPNQFSSVQFSSVQFSSVQEETTTITTARTREEAPPETESVQDGCAEIVRQSKPEAGLPQQSPKSPRGQQPSALEEIFNPGPSCAIVEPNSDIIHLWNQEAPRSVRVPEDGTPAIDRAISGCVLHCPPITVDEIKGAIENYGMAVGLPKSQAAEHSLGRFLTGLIGDPRSDTAKFLPGNFNLANFDSTKFARAGPGEKPFDAEETEKRLKSKGLL